MASDPPPTCELAWLVGVRAFVMRDRRSSHTYSEPLGAPDVPASAAFSSAVGATASSGERSVSGTVSRYLRADPRCFDVLDRDAAAGDIERHCAR